MSYQPHDIASTEPKLPYHTSLVTRRRRRESIAFAFVYFCKPDLWAQTPSFARVLQSAPDSDAFSNLGGKLFTTNGAHRPLGDLLPVASPKFNYDAKGFLEHFFNRWNS